MVTDRSPGCDEFPGESRLFVVRYNWKRQHLYRVSDEFQGSAYRRVKSSLCPSAPAAIHQLAFVPDGMKFERSFQVAADGKITEVFEQEF